MKNRIGLIAEDKSDVAVITELTKKIAGDRQFSTRKFVGNGCGKIKGKCVQWAEALKINNVLLSFYFMTWTREILKNLQSI